ncbi:MAG: XTP/dITP diphosphatase [Candidatus Hydrothermarchaeales archaeon]
MTKISFITTNPNKFNEMKELFNTHGLELGWINRKLPEIQASTLEDVVKHALSTAGMKNVFIEDAGFFIGALGGFPGVYSRYVYDTIGNAGILRLLEGEKNREARFVAVIGYRGEGEDIKLFKGETKGNVSLLPRGEKGFGYDPIFVPEGFEKTFGEDKVLKSQVSHRKRAAEKLIHYLTRS